MLYTFVIVPFLAFLAAVPVAWGWGMGWTDVVLFLAFYYVSGLGITVGYHRLFTHSSFKANRGLRIALAVAGSLAIEGPVIRWVADHRRHHAYSDRDGDPHSPWRFGDDAPAPGQGVLVRPHRLAVRPRAHQPRQVHARPDARQGHPPRRRAVPGSGAGVGVPAGRHRRAGHHVVGRRAVGVLLGLARAHLPAAPRHLVDQLGLPHDRRAAVRRRATRAPTSGRWRS